MAVLEWDKVGERFYETGVDRGVLYIPNVAGEYTNGYAWNGLTTVTESPSGAEATAIYADNIKYLNLVSAEEFGATVEAYTYPPEFAQCDGSAAIAVGVYAAQQPRKTFGLSYRTRVGNDQLAAEYGYKIHLVYGALAAPSERAFATINDTPEAITFSWELTTSPVSVGSGFKPTASLVIDSTKVTAAQLKALEDILYGTASLNPRLPLPAEVIGIFAGSQTEVTVVAPTATAAGVITIPNVTGVEYRRADTGAKVTGTTTITGAIGTSLTIRAVPVNGTYKFSAASDDDFVFTKTA